MDLHGRPRWHTAPMDEGQRSFATQAFRTAREWMLDRTVPIYAWAHGGLPVLEGSGILLKIADAGFLVTAAHVVDGVVKDGRALFMGMADGEGIVNLGGLDFQVSDDQRDVDVAFTRLPPGIVDVVGKHRAFLRLDQIDTARRPPAAGVYIIAGYPRGDSRADGDAGLIHSKAFCLSTTLHEGELANFTVGSSIALSFLSPWVIQDDGERIRAPALQGISGCGIWRMVSERHPTPGHWDTTSIRLAGIEHGIVGKAIKGLLAFRLVDYIRQNHPDLAPAIELVRQAEPHLPHDSPDPITGTGEQLPARIDRRVLRFVRLD